MPASSGAPAARPAEDSGSQAIHRRNRALLRQLGRCRQQQARLRWRNALVESNMALVRMVAQKESRRTGRPFDELCSAGYEGLVHAIESFDVARQVSLSSYVVPYVRGAMLQDRRDRQQPLQTPRRLRDLHRKAERWLEAQRVSGQPPVDSAGLARALGCTLAQLEEAGRVHRALQLGSLDSPIPGGGGEGEGMSRLDLLPDPASFGDEREDDPAARCQRRWLRQRLAGMAPQDRHLLEGHWLDGRSWCELALELRLPARSCRLRGAALLARLQAEGAASPSARASSTASPAARRV